MRRRIAYPLAGMVGLALGAALALSPWAARIGAQPVSIAQWRADWSIGAPSTRPGVRAGVARRGLMALPQSEAVYFIARRDDAGRPLRTDCEYSLDLPDQRADWWSLTLYDETGFLARNSGPASVSRDDGVERVILSATDPGTAWLNSRDAGAFDLTLRLYAPDPELIAAPQDVVRVPTITRLSCA